MSIYRISDLFRLPDCSALSERGRCTRLKVFSCKGAECTFVKSKKEEKDSLKKAYERLSMLDISIQKHIAEKYYNGSMPWNEVKIS